MIKYSILKIRKGKKATWLKWCVYLMKHKKEGVETIIEEDLVRERCIIIGDYVFYEHETVPGKKKKPYNPNRKINIMHAKKCKECLNFIGQVLVKNGDMSPGYDYKVKGKK